MVPFNYLFFAKPLALRFFPLIESALKAAANICPSNFTCPPPFLAQSIISAV